MTVQERCSANFIVNVTRNIFSETPPVAAPFREDVPITLGDIQGLQLSETKRKECNLIFKLFIFLDFDNIKKDIVKVNSYVDIE